MHDAVVTRIPEDTPRGGIEDFWSAIGIDLDEGHVEIANARAQHWSSLTLD